MIDKPPKDMGGEELRTAARRQDRKLSIEIDRLRISDPQFRAVLDRSVELDEEIDRRKGR